MGTRSALTVINKVGEIKVCQYGQSDGYVNGLGINLLNLLKKKHFLLDLEKCLSKLTFIDSETEKTWRNKVGSTYEKTFLDRELKHKVLENIVSSKKDSITLIELKNGWSENICFNYIVNYQTNKFTVEFVDELSPTYELENISFDLLNLPDVDYFVSVLPKEN